MARARRLHRDAAGRRRQRPTLALRLPDWERRLSAYLRAAGARAHDYGRHDCLLHAAAVVKAVTGRDLTRGRKGHYRTALGAARQLRALGFETGEHLIDSLLPPRPPGFARRGDLVMGADGIPGVCLGDKAAFVGLLDESGAVREGLVTTPRSEWVRAWTVGEA